MAAWSQDDDVLFGNKNKIIYDNPSFTRTPLNEIVGDRTID